MKLLDDLVETRLYIEPQFSNPPYFVEKAVEFTDQCDLPECFDCHALLLFTSDRWGDIIRLQLKSPQDMGPTLTHYVIDIERHCQDFLKLAQTWFGISPQQLLSIINQAAKMQTPK